MTMDSSVNGEELRIALRGSIDANVAYQPYEEMVARTDVGAENIERVVLDVGGVTFADSTALGMIVRMNQHAQEIGVSFQVHDTPPAVRRILDMTALSADLDLT